MSKMDKHSEAPEQLEDVLPDYTGHRGQCVKCWTVDASTRYQTWTSRAGLAVVPGTPSEWLLRECRCCGYRWDEACVSQV